MANFPDRRAVIESITDDSTGDVSPDVMRDIVARAGNPVYFRDVALSHVHGSTDSTNQNDPPFAAEYLVGMVRNGEIAYDNIALSAKFADNPSTWDLAKNESWLQAGLYDELVANGSMPDERWTRLLAVASTMLTPNFCLQVSSGAHALCQAEHNIAIKMSW